MRTPMLAVLTISALALAASPAHATGYVPSGPCAGITGVPEAGATVTVTFVDHAFEPGEQVEFVATGTGTVLLDGTPGPAGIQKAATQAGSASVGVTLPTPASGDYTVTGTGVGSARSCTVALTVTPVNTVLAPTVSAPTVSLPSPGTAASPARPTTLSDGSSALAATGYDAPFLVMWAAGGALLLGLVLTASIAIARRNNASPDRPPARVTGRHKA